MRVVPRYAVAWNEITGKPDPTWLTTEQAQAAYQAEGPSLLVIDGDHPVVGSKQAVRAQWRIKFAPDGRVRVGWADEHGSALRQAYFETIDGRLFRTRITDRTYPDNDQRWLMFEAVVRRNLDFHPDGAVFIEVRRAGSLDVERGITASDEMAWWLDRPRFGHWEDLLNPGYGLPADDPILDPRLARAWGLTPPPAAQALDPTG